MKKKVNVFGKGVPVLAIFVLGIALVSAALVPYLSGMVVGNVDVDSPFEVRILGEGQTLPVYGDLGFDPVTVSGVHGGETFEVTVGFKNLADVPMDVFEKFVISAVDPSGDIISPFSCEDFESIGWYTCTNECSEWDAIQYLNMVTECDDTTGNIVIPYPNHYDAGEINVDLFEVTLKENALGTYTFSAQIVPTP